MSEQASHHLRRPGFFFFSVGKPIRTEPWKRPVSALWCNLVYSRWCAGSDSCGGSSVAMITASTRWARLAAAVTADGRKVARLRRLFLCREEGINAGAMPPKHVGFFYTCWCFCHLLRNWSCCWWIHCQLWWGYLNVCAFSSFLNSEIYSTSQAGFSSSLFFNYWCRSMTEIGNASQLLIVAVLWEGWLKHHQYTCTAAILRRALSKRSHRIKIRIRLRKST